MEELGKAIGKSQSAVADYEKGRVDIPASSLIKIAEVLEVHPAKLFGMQTADEQFKPDATLRIFSAEDRRIIAGILVMNGYTTRHIKVAREGKKSRKPSSNVSMRVITGGRTPSVRASGFPWSKTW